MKIIPLIVLWSTLSVVTEAAWDVVEECCFEWEVYPDCGRRLNVNNDNIALTGDDSDAFMMSLGDQEDWKFDPDLMLDEKQYDSTVGAYYEDTDDETAGVLEVSAPANGSDDDDGKEARMDEMEGSSPLLRRRDSRHLRGTVYGPYQIRMYWEDHFCWQAEKRERRWCMECVGDECAEGKNLHTMPCDSNDDRQLIEYVAQGGGAGQLRIHGTNLCLQATKIFFKLQPCQNNLDQYFIGFNTAGAPFQLKPFRNQTMCVTNWWHHPKPKEVLWRQKCSIPQKHYTDKWVAVTDGVDTVEVESRNAGGTAKDEDESTGSSTLMFGSKQYCTNKDPCDKCQGDCDSDLACKGTLQCFTRKKNKAVSVPGCGGTPDLDGHDYCYDPNDENGMPAGPPTEATTTSTTTPVWPQTAKAVGKGSEGCVPDKPCGMCEGDCDEDDDCQQGLVCVQRNKGDSLGPCEDNAAGSFQAGQNDYCVPESM